MRRVEDDHQRVRLQWRYENNGSWFHRDCGNKFGRPGPMRRTVRIVYRLNGPVHCMQTEAPHSAATTEGDRKGISPISEVRDREVEGLTIGTYPFFAPRRIDRRNFGSISLGVADRRAIALIPRPTIRTCGRAIQKTDDFGTRLGLVRPMTRTELIPTEAGPEPRTSGSRSLSVEDVPGVPRSACLTARGRKFRCRGAD